MSLWIDRRGPAAPPAVGQLHALVIGVSYYDHLPRPNEFPPLGRETLQLCQVETPATSAYNFAKWLRDKYRNPAAPLATLRVVMSPSLAELQDIDGLKAVSDKVPVALTAHVEQAMDD